MYSTKCCLVKKGNSTAGTCPRQPSSVSPTQLLCANKVLLRNPSPLIGINGSYEHSSIRHICLRLNYLLSLGLL